MGLQETLQKMKEGFEAQIPADKLAIMHRTTVELAASGIIEKALKIGDSAPAFTLPNEKEEDVSSVALLQNGPLVVCFYRGIW